MDIKAAIECSPLLKPEDADDVEIIAMCLSGSENPGEDAIIAAASCINAYRKMKLRQGAWERVRDLPTRQTIPATGPDARYYWRVALSDGRLVQAAREGLRGNVTAAKAAAVELIAQGLEPVELVPPDYDPQMEARQSSATGRWRRNVTAARSKH